MKYSFPLQSNLIADLIGDLLVQPDVKSGNGNDNSTLAHANRREVGTVCHFVGSRDADSQLLGQLPHIHNGIWHANTSLSLFVLRILYTSTNEFVKRKY